MVECFLAKEDVAGSTPVSRSKSVDLIPSQKLEQRSNELQEFTEELDTGNQIALGLQFNWVCS